MPTPMPPGFRLGIAEPQDAIAAFQRRSLLQPSFRWQDVFQEEHARAFAVAGVQRLDLLELFRTELELGVREGRSLADFAKRIRPRLAEKGWAGPVEISDPNTGELRTIEFNDARLRTVFDVNMRQSHAAGRWARIERTKATLPFVMYRTAQDERVRAAHAAWDGIVLPVGHPFWQTHYPPNGWRCRCRAFALTQRDIDRRRAEGELIKTEAPPERLVSYVNPRTGEVAAVPRGIDPGFGYNPGQLRDAELADALLGKAARAEAVPGAVALREALAEHPQLLSQRLEAFGAWVDEALASKGAGRKLFKLGVVQPEIVRAVAAAGAPLDNAVLSVLDLDVHHGLRPGKSRGKPRRPIPPELYKRLPELIAKPSAALLHEGELVYAVEVPDASGKLLKLVILINRKETAVVDGERSKQVLNLVRTASLQTEEDLRSLKDARLVWGAWSGR